MTLRPATPTAVAAAALLLAACGGGSVRTPGPGSSATGWQPAPMASEPSAPPSPSSSGAARTGSAKVTHGGTTVTYAERACQTTRGLDGKVAGWMATFQDTAEQAKRYSMGITDSASYVVIRLRDYTGAAAYPSERVSVRLGDARGEQAYATGFGTRGQTLTLRDGGKAGTYRSGELTVEFSCDPSDDTSTAAGAAVPDPPAPGTGYVVRPEGAAFTFGPVRCGKQGSDTSVVAGTFPQFFRVLTGAEAGESAGARILYGMHGVVISYTGPSARAEVTATGGTFRYTPGAPNSTKDVTRGAWTCA